MSIRHFSYLSLSLLLGMVIFLSYRPIATSASVTPVLLNELVANVPGSDGGYEYIELRQNGATTLAGVSLVILEGDAGTSSGSADFLLDLSSATFGASGLLVVHGTNISFTVPSNTTSISDSDLNSIENGSLTFLLVQGSGMVQGQDYDANDDGVLELPLGVTILDAVGWSDGGASDRIYGGVALSQTSGMPHAASRFVNNLQPLSAAAWFSGEIAGSSADSTLYDPAAASSNLPAGATITRGSANTVTITTPTPTPTLPPPPQILLNEIVVNPPSSDAGYEYVELREVQNNRSPNALNDVSLVILEGDAGTSQGSADVVIDLTSASVGANGLLVAHGTTISFTLPVETASLSDGDLNSIENGSISFLLTYGAGIVQGQDYDSNDDGVLELPSGITILDAVGWRDGDALDHVYGGVVLTQSTGWPSAATRFEHLLTAKSASAWFNGELLGSSADGTQYDPQAASSNLPQNGIITRGRHNTITSTVTAIQLGQSSTENTQAVPLFFFTLLLLSLGLAIRPKTKG